MTTTKAITTCHSCLRSPCDPRCVVVRERESAERRGREKASAPVEACDECVVSAYADGTVSVTPCRRCREESDACRTANPQSSDESRSESRGGAESGGIATSSSDSNDTQSSGRDGMAGDGLSSMASGGSKAPTECDSPAATAAPSGASSSDALSAAIAAAVTTAPIQNGTGAFHEQHVLCLFGRDVGMFGAESAERHAAYIRAEIAKLTTASLPAAVSPAAPSDDVEAAARVAWDASEAFFEEFAPEPWDIDAAKPDLHPEDIGSAVDTRNRYRAIARAVLAHVYGNVANWKQSAETMAEHAANADRERDEAKVALAFALTRAREAEERAEREAADRRNADAASAKWMTECERLRAELSKTADFAVREMTESLDESCAADVVRRERDDLLSQARSLADILCPGVSEDLLTAARAMRKCALDSGEHGAKRERARIVAMVRERIEKHETTLAKAGRAGEGHIAAYEAACRDALVVLLASIEAGESGGGE